MWYYLHMYSRSLMLASIDLIAIIGELIVLANSSKNNKDVGQPVFNSLIKVLMFVTFTDLLSWFLVDVKTDFLRYLGILDGFFNYFLPTWLGGYGLYMPIPSSPEPIPNPGPRHSSSAHPSLH